MRKVLFLAILAVSIFTQWGCEKSKDDLSPSNVSSTILNGSWRVAYFYEDNRDETSDYASDRFVFTNPGNITVTSGSNTYSGVWATYIDDGKTKLNLDFLAPARLLELTEDWEVTEINENRILLKDISGSGSTDWLRFER